MSEVIKRKSARPWLRLGALSLLMALLISISAQVSFAGSVTIHDDANILNSSARNTLTSQGSSLPYNVAILTNSSYNSNTTFDNQVNSFISSFNGLVIAVSPSLHHTYVVASSNLGISSSQDTSLSAAGNSFFQQSNWQGGISAILNQARSYGNVSTGSTSNSGSFPSTTTSNSSTRSSGGFPIWGCLIIGIIAFVAFSVFGAGRRNNANNNRGGNYSNNFVPGNGNGYGPGYNGGYNNGGYNNGGGGGIGPLGGGVIGAGLGGVAGYEIGKNVGENEHNNNSGFFGGNNNNNGSNWGNDNSGGGFTAGGSDWGNNSGNSGGNSGGGGGGSDWGSSGGSFGSGGGGDWGGGGGGGGGGDSGGGGGGGSSW